MSLYSSRRNKGKLEVSNVIVSLLTSLGIVGLTFGFAACDSLTKGSMS